MQNAPDPADATWTNGPITWIGGSICDDAGTLEIPVQVVDAENEWRIVESGIMRIELGADGVWHVELPPEADVS